MLRPNSLFLLLIPSLFFLSFPLTTFAQKDHFKAYLKVSGQDNPSRLQANKLILQPNGKDFYVLSELKAASPDYTNYALLISVDAEGNIQESSTLSSNVQNAVDGVRASSICFDTDGQLYIGGGYTGSWNPLGTGAERTLSALDAQGNLKWSQMQSSFYFADILYDADIDRIISLSGPSNLANTNYNIQINQFARDGKLGQTFSILSSSQDYGKALISLESKDYGFAGTSYDAGKGSVLVGKIDQSLSLIWASKFSHPDLDMEVQDMSQHPGGRIAISGTANDIKSGSQKAFLLILGNTGELVSFTSYQIGTACPTEGMGMEAFEYNGKDGFILSGFYYESNPKERRSFVLRSNLEGEIDWVNTYSEYRPEDNSWDEVLRDIQLLPSEGQFAAIGEVNRYKNGIELDRKALVMVKGSLEEGSLSSGEDCYEGLQAASESYSLNQESLTSASILPNSAIGFAYQQPTISVENGYCSFGSVPENEDPQEDIRNRFPDRISLDQEAYLIFKNGPQSISFRSKYGFMPKAGKLEVFDITGRKLESLILSPNDHSKEIVLPQLSYGMYFILLKDGEHLIDTQRFLLGF
ncbi:MAG: T9SS type A sorting domain-containing protein [Bacteroidia bacterium]|nr:T9SS type A sorting domain-containing protein [Bacteroidia bacterium]